jgi:hypothetical protein
MHRLCVFLGALALIGPARASANDNPSSRDACLGYTQVKVRGVLTSQTFPGPPNYSSVASGDTPETYYFVALTQPMCVDKGESQLEPAVARVKRIQLIFDWQATHASYGSLQTLLNRPVECSGLLLGQHTGHHHSEVMLTEAKCNGT